VLPIDIAWALALAGHVNVAALATVHVTGRLPRELTTSIVELAVGLNSEVEEVTVTVHGFVEQSLLVTIAFATVAAQLVAAVVWNWLGWIDAT
jgi:hypothetical protein